MARSSTAWSSNKDLNAYVREAEKQGCSVSFTGKGHLRIIGPKGIAFCPSPPSKGCRSLENTRADLRRIGVEI